MVPSLLILSTTTLSIVLCTAFPREQADTQHHALRRGDFLDGLGVLPLGPSALLKPRVTLPPYLMGPEWLVDQHDFTCMLPIGSAAALLQDFYEDLAAYAATTLDPASRGYHIWLGQILLEIVAPAGVIVDWTIVQHFALDMLRMTKRGYTNTYQINFIHRPTGMMVTFSLYAGFLRAATSAGA